MRKRSRAAAAAPPESVEPPESAESALRLDTMFDPRHDAGTGTSGRDPGLGRDGSRTRMITIGAVVLVVGIAAAAALGIRAGLDDDSGAASDPAPSRRDLGDPPAELPATGTAIRSRVTANGDVVVTQWIRSRFPVTDLGVQTQPRGAGTAKAGDVTVVADGETVAPLEEGAPSLRFAFGVPAELVRLRYVLTGAVDRSPSVPGRALVRATSLRVDYSPVQGPTVVTVTAPEVLSMTCSNGETVLSASRPCGRPTAGGWRVTLPENRRDQVSAQVDLGD